MALFSWFLKKRKVQFIDQKPAQIDEKVTLLNNNAMWPTASVRRNTIVKQHEFNNSKSTKETDKAKSPLTEKES